MTTKFETIEDTELIEYIMSDLDSTIRRNFMRESFLGYRVNLHINIVRYILNNSELKDSIFYNEIGFEKLTNEILDSDEFRRIHVKHETMVTCIYLNTHEAVKSVLNLIRK